MLHSNKELEEFHKKINQLIPGGSHTYAKSDDRFPYNAPKFVYKGKNGHIWDTLGNEYIDWGMGCRSVLLGHAYEPVLKAVRAELGKGVNFARPSHIEGDLAELMLNTIKGYDMCKFGKNGSDATTAAIKLARAYTKKDKILICDKSFFSINDWYIGTQPINSGIPRAIRDMTLKFSYNDLDGLKRIIYENKEQVACLIMEVTRDEEPVPGFLTGIRKLCSDNNIILIFDEIITGFRYNLHGAQSMHGITADLTTFGKSMANGFSISALLGKRELMELGGLKHKNEKVFLLSQTYGGETHCMAAAIESIKENREKNVSKEVWIIGGKLKDGLNKISKELELDDNIFAGGYNCTPTVKTQIKNEFSATLSTLFMEKILIKDNILLPPLGPSFTHTEDDIDRTLEAIEYSMLFCKKAIEENKVERYMHGPILKPSLRRFN